MTHVASHFSVVEHPGLPEVIRSLIMFVLVNVQLRNKQRLKCS